MVVFMEVIFGAPPTLTVPLTTITTTAPPYTDILNTMKSVSITTPAFLIFPKSEGLPDDVSIYQLVREGFMKKYHYDNGVILKKINDI